MRNVFCVGELLIDFVAENQGNELIKADTFSKKAGGAPANVACAIAKLNGNSVFIGCVGKDAFGEFLIKTLKDEGVDVSLIQKSDTFTTMAFVSIDREGERDFVFSRGADKELRYKSEFKTGIKDNIVHFGAATGFLGGHIEKTYNACLQDAVEQNSFISFDPNFRGDLWEKNESVFIQKCTPFIRKAHICKFSLQEARLLSTKTDLKEACTYLHNLGVPIITITLGHEGTLLSTKDSQQIIPSIPVKAVDTTGAGDAFIGCLLKQISEVKALNEILGNTNLLQDMVQIANKAGAITTTNYGAIAALPSQLQING